MTRALQQSAKNIDGRKVGFTIINTITSRKDDSLMMALKLSATSGVVARDDNDDSSSSSSDDSRRMVYMRGGGKEVSQVSPWPSNDALDRKLIAIALPCILNYAINPLVGAVDLFWVNRMGNALAVAGQAAANQVFNSAFWLASFLPSGEYVYTMMYDVF
jgi:hypothetical protein